MRQHSCEVVVVGAGPAGSFAALRLAQLGHDVALVDKNETARCGIVCTGIVGREACERLDLPEGSMIDTVGRARFISPSGVEVIYEPRKPLAKVVDRTRFDRELAARAAEAGVTLIRGWTACGVEKAGNGLTIALRTGDGSNGRVALRNGTRCSLRARALIVATGHQSHLHREAGLGRPPGYVHGVNADLPFEDLDAAELYFGNGIAPGFFAWAIPFGRGMARLGVLAPKAGRTLFHRFLTREPIRARLRLGLQNEGREPIQGGIQGRIRSRAIVQGVVRPSYSDRVLAVGEAAGQLKTTTAGGIYYGMIGAEIAAEILSDGLRKEWLSASHLGRYQQAWEDRLGGEIRTGMELQDLARTMSDPEIDALFLALQNGLASSVRHLVRFDWHRPALKVLLGKSKAWRLGKGTTSALGLG